MRHRVWGCWLLQIALQLQADEGDMCTEKEQGNQWSRPAVEAIVGGHTVRGHLPLHERKSVNSEASSHHIVRHVKPTSFRLPTRRAYRLHMGQVPRHAMCKFPLPHVPARFVLVLSCGDLRTSARVPRILRGPRAAGRALITFCEARPRGLVSAEILA